MKRRRRTAGLASVLAVALIALVGLAVAALTTRIDDARRRLPDQRTGAQLRAMLMTGAAASPRLVPASVDAPAAEDQMVLALPRALIARDGRIKLTARDALAGFARIVTVEARLDGRTMRQSLRYLKADAGWGLAETTLRHDE